MMQQELVLDYEYYHEEQCSFQDLQVASNKLTAATEAQFEEIKNEKWFNRVFNLITFSNNKEKRMANQIQNITQAQELFIEVLVRLSERDTRISELVSESFEQIEQLSQNDVLLAKRIHQLEKRSILGITKETDIEDLSETEREILGGLFYELMQRFTDVSEYQKNYANSVLNYLEVEAQEINVIEAIHSIKNIDKKKKIFTCCLEYSFLNGLSFDFPEKVEDLVDEFDFGNRTMREVKKQIQALYHLRGVDGFMDRYGNYDDIDESFYAEIPVIETVEEEIEVEQQAVTIDTILHIPKGETKVFKNNIIQINSFIKCEGNLEFQNCIIHYNDSDTPDEITLGEGATLKISHSKVICHGLDESPFIQGAENNQIELYESSFYDCAFFIEAENNATITMDGCQLYNPFVNFFKHGNYANEMEVVISNSSIHFSELLAKFYQENTLSGFGNDSVINLYGSILVKECTILAEDGFKFKSDDQYTIFNFLNGAEFENCTFRNLDHCINGFTKISKCIFDNCVETINANYQEGEIINSLFIANEQAIEGNNLLIENNQFVDCKNEVISGRELQIQFCEFYNLTNDVNLDVDEYQSNNSDSHLLKSNSAAASISLSIFKDDTQTTIHKCLFNGVDTQAGFLIKGNTIESISSPKVVVKDCHFQNCATKRESNKIIKESSYYFGLFNKMRKTYPVKIENCTGLENTNKENNFVEDFVIKTKTTSGEIIGASLDM